MNNLQSEMEQLLKDISILDFTLVDFRNIWIRIHSINRPLPILTITIKSVWI